MNKRKYSKILLVVMSIMICVLIGIQFYLTLYMRRQQELFPEILTWFCLFLEIGLLAVLLASSNVNQAVGNLAFTDVTGINWLIRNISTESMKDLIHFQLEW